MTGSRISAPINHLGFLAHMRSQDFRTLARMTNTHTSGRKTMKRLLATTALSLALVLSVGIPAAMASPQTRAAAVKTCHDLYLQSIKTANDSYNEAVKDAKTKKGKERKDALAAASKARLDSKVQAKESEKTCIAKAPKK
jgi:ABC-type sugar transport system substrate-binding protein